MDPSIGVELRQNPVTHHAPSSEVAASGQGGAGSQNESKFRVLRGTRAEVEIDAQGNRKLVSKDRAVHSETVRPAYGNFWENYVSRFAQLRDRNQGEYDQIMGTLDPTVASLVKRMMTEDRDAQGDALKWKVNNGEVTKFLQSEPGLKITTMLIAREQALQAAGRRKYQSQELDIGRSLTGMRRETMYKLRNSPDMWDYANNPDLKNYLKQIWEIDVDDPGRADGLLGRLRPAANVTIAGRTLTIPSLRGVMPNRTQETIGASQLKEAFQSAADARVVYNKDALGYKGELSDSPLQGVIEFGRSHGFMGLKGTTDSEIEARIMRNFNKNQGGIQDRAHRPLEILNAAGDPIRNPDFDNTQIDAVGNIQRYFEAESVTLAEYYQELLRDENIAKAEGERASARAVLEAKANALREDVDPGLTKRKTEATTEKTRLGQERAEVVSQEQIFSEYRSQTDIMNAASGELRRLGLYTVSDGALKLDVIDAVAGEKTRLQTDLDTTRVGLNTTLRTTINGLNTTLRTTINGLNTTLQTTVDGINAALEDVTVGSLGAQTRLREIEDEIRVEKARLLAGRARSPGDEARAEESAILTIDRNRPGQRLRAKAEIAREVARIARLEQQNTPEIARLEQENAQEIARLEQENAQEIARLEQAHTQEVARLDALENQYKIAADARNGAERTILEMAPKDELAKMRDAHAILVTGGITPAMLTDMSIDQLDNLFKPWSGLFGRMSTEDRRQLVARAKAEQLASNQEANITSPALHVAFFDEITHGAPRHGHATPTNPITPDELVFMDETTLRNRLINEYGWSAAPADEHANWLDIQRARAEARQRLAIRSKTLTDVKVQDIDEQIEAQDKILADKPGSREKKKAARFIQVDELCGEHEDMMQKSIEVVEAIRTGDEYTDTSLIAAADATYSKLEKKINAPKGYYKILEYCGYDRNNESMEARNTQLQEMQLILKPDQLALYLYDHLPNVWAQVQAAGGAPGQIGPTLDAIRDLVRSGDIQAEDLRGAVRRMMDQLVEETNQVE